ncbi:MAG: MFS transporter [Peptococcaceae bacterium]|nr:MFS transporter [Peptococcaceae bacterium]
MAEITVTPEQESSFRWTMMALCTLVMALGFIPMASFGVVAPAIAKSMHVSLSKVSLYGGDAFSTGIWAAFIPGHSGWFDKKPKVGVIIASALAIVPQFLLPVAGSLWFMTILRFFQGFIIMVLAIFAFQLSGWFRPSERGISFGFTVGAISLAGFLGGLLVNALAPLGWRATDYISGLIMIVGLVLYLIFAKDAPTFMKGVLAAKEKESVHQSAWGWKMSWIMGLVQLPLVWVLFTTGGFMPLFAIKVGHYTAGQAGTLVLIWGLAGFVISVLGSRYGDYLCKGKTTHREVVNVRLKIIIAGDILMGLAAVAYITIGHLGFGAMVFAVILNSFMWLVPPNYWATPGNVYPLALMGAGAFVMGIVSNAGSPIGALVSSALLPGLGWNGVFILMAAVSFAGIFICIWGMKSQLPSEDPKYTAG